MSDAQIPPFHSEAGSDSTVQEFKYEKVFGVLEFDDVVKKLTEVNKRAVLCLGDAGMGKTICLKNIVCSYYVDKSSFMLKQAKSFELIYYIPVRDVDTKATVVDILCSLNLIQPHMKQTLRCVLEDKEAACKLLLLLDGLDEKDVEEGTELHQLIHGEIYPHVKLIMSARPQATVLKHFYPNVRVTIKGTTEEGVTTYLRNTSRIVTSIAEKDIDDVISRCKKQMYNYELLQVPLYLTLMRKIIIDYCKKEDKIENFVVPKTRTRMLNRFILNIVQNWLIRLGREEEANDLFFQRNILQKSSVAPRDIKQKFLAFSRLSYHCMLSEVYDFDDDCLNRYHIPPKDVTKSGLFHWSELGGKLQCSFTHKQFQEYLSGLYMADYRLNDATLYKLINNAQNPKKEDTLRNVFRPLGMAVNFLFGLDPEFAADLVQQLKEHGSIGDLESNVLRYELQLCAESRSEVVNKSMGQLLLTANIGWVDIENYSMFSLPVTEVEAMIQISKHLTSEQHITLLSKWCDLTIEIVEESLPGQEYSQAVIRQSEEHYYYHNFPEPLIGENDKHNELYIGALNQMLYILLTPFVFPHVRKLRINVSGVTDVALFTRVLFPKVEDILIYGLVNIQPDKVLHKYFLTPSRVIPGGSTLKHINLGLPLSETTVNSLVAEKQLESLTLMFMPHAIQKLEDTLSETTVTSLGKCKHIRKLTIDLCRRDRNQAADDKQYILEKLSTVVNEHCKHMELFVKYKDYKGPNKITEKINTMIK